MQRAQLRQLVLLGSQSVRFLKVDKLIRLVPITNPMKPPSIQPPQ